MTAATIISDRMFGIYTCALGSSNLDGDQSILIELPAGIGDSMLLAWSINISQIATLLTDARTQYGPIVSMNDTLSQTIIEPAMAHMEVWRGGADATAVRAEQQLRRPVVWRTSDSVRVQFEEIDTNATPTADLAVNLVCRRLRN